MTTGYYESEKVIKAFLMNHRVVDVAKSAGISKSTVYKLKNDSHFQQVLSERRADLVKRSVDEMRSYLLKDVQVLQAIIEDSNVNASTRVYAIATMMSQLKDWTTIVDLEQRLTALEKAKNNGFSLF